MKAHTFEQRISELEHLNTKDLEDQLIGIEMDLDIAQREHSMKSSEASKFEKLIEPYNKKLYALNVQKHDDTF